MRVKLLLFASTLISLVMLNLGMVYAVDVVKPVCDKNNSLTVCKDNNTSGADNPILGPHGILTTAVQILTIIVGVAAVIVIIIAGLRFIVSNGDSNSVSSARGAVIYALIGLAIAAVSQAIISFVLNRINV